MKRAKIGGFMGGWFIGNFEPSLYRTNACEVAVKHYEKGCAVPQDSNGIYRDHQWKSPDVRGSV